MIFQNTIFVMAHAIHLHFFLTTAIKNGQYGAMLSGFRLHVYRALVAFTTFSSTCIYYWNAPAHNLSTGYIENFAPY